VRLPAAALLSFFAAVSIFAADRSHDLYPRYSALAAAFEEGTDYRVISRARKSTVLVTAIHGGSIEPGTSELARLVAGRNHSLYLFESLLRSGTGWKHHITSTHFDEPRATDLVSASRTVVSIHGFWYVRAPGTNEPPTVMLGGRNAALRERVRAALHAFRDKHMPELVVRDGYGRFAGMAAKNIANRAEEAGVQIELSRALREAILKSPLVRKRLARRIRSAIRAWMCESLLR
jgi:phage replication-related protein YjqB (UPF0714/DUF867 family)